MRIVFGHNHFRIKKVQPHEIGLFNREFDNITFDLQQKYAHLYWIPFFPLGKVWTVNKGDGKKYVCHPEVEQMLDQNPGRGGKKAIFAWSGFLAIGLGFLIFSLVMKAEAYSFKKSSEKRFKEESELLSQQIDSLKADDYVMMERKRGDDPYYNTATPFKVMAVKGDDVLLGYYDVENFNRYSISGDEGIIGFLQDNNVDDSFWVTKAFIKQGIPSEQAARDTARGITFAAAPGAQFHTSEIKHLEGPVIEEDFNAPGKSDTYFELVNKGFDAHADSVVALSDSSSCKLSKQKDFSQSKSVALQLFGPGPYALYLSDKAKHSYAFRLDKYGSTLEITKL